MKTVVQNSLIQFQTAGIGEHVTDEESNEVRTDEKCDHIWYIDGVGFAWKERVLRHFLCHRDSFNHAFGIRL